MLFPYHTINREKCVLSSILANNSNRDELPSFQMLKCRFFRKISKDGSKDGSQTPSPVPRLDRAKLTESNRRSIPPGPPKCVRTARQAGSLSASIFT